MFSLKSKMMRVMVFMPLSPPVLLLFVFLAAIFLSVVTNESLVLGDLLVRTGEIENLATMVC